MKQSIKMVIVNQVMPRLKSHAGGHVEHPSNLADCVDKAGLCISVCILRDEVAMAS